MKTSKTTYGIIGYPVEHSLSPLMHHAAFKAMGVEAEYKLFPLKEEELDGFFTNLHEKSSPIFGLNVTVPYKETVVKYMDSLSPFAQKVNAVNTIVISDDRRLIGHNTDGPGFLTHLTELGFNTRDRRIAIFGAGGTTRAIIVVLCLLPARPKTIRIYNRTKENLDKLLKDLAERCDTSIVQAVASVDELDIELADLLINTTSVGMKPDDVPLVSEEVLHRDMLVYDVIYSPQETKLLQMGKKKGAKVSNGLGMLFYQGVLALQHWADMPVNEKIKVKMREGLMEGLNKI